MRIKRYQSLAGNYLVPVFLKLSPIGRHASLYGASIHLKKESHLIEKDNIGTLERYSTNPNSLSLFGESERVVKYILPIKCGRS